MGMSVKFCVCGNERNIHTGVFFDKIVKNKTDEDRIIAFRNLWIQF